MAEHRIFTTAFAKVYPMYDAPAMHPNTSPIKGRQ